MNTELKKNAKNDFEKEFFNLIDNAVFGKIMENVSKHRDQARNNKARRNYFVSEPNHHTTKFFRKIH